MLRSAVRFLAKERLRDDISFSQFIRQVRVTFFTYSSFPRWHTYLMPAHYYYVYIMSSQRRALYIGVTSTLERRIFQHKTHAFEGFTAKYNISSLVYMERYAAIHAAIGREKELKAWRREKKIALIESINPQWNDLSYGWFQKHRYAPSK